MANAGKKKPMVKVRLTEEFKIRKTFNLHPDAFAALERMAKRFSRKYGRSKVRQKLASFGLLELERSIKNAEVKPSEDIDQALGI